MDWWAIWLAFGFGGSLVLAVLCWFEGVNITVRGALLLPLFAVLGPIGFASTSLDLALQVSRPWRRSLPWRGLLNRVLIEGRRK